MSQLKSKIIPLAIIVVLGGAAGVGLVLSKSKDSNNGSGSVANQSQSRVYSPTDIYSQLSRYTGKELTFKGRLFKVGDGYFIVGSEKKPGAIKLDFTKNSIDPAKYVYNSSDPKAAGPSTTKPHEVTITGKAVKNDPKAATTLVVSSIKD